MLLLRHTQLYCYQLLQKEFSSASCLRNFLLFAAKHSDKTFVLFAQYVKHISAMC